MKLNEILLIGGALVAALVLSKGRGLSSTNSTIPFINPFSNLLDQAQTQTIQKLDTNIKTLESVRQSNLGIAQSILNYERSIKDVNISQINTELDKTQSYISQQQKIRAPALLTRDQSYWADQMGGIKAYALRIIGGAAQTETIGGRNISDGRFQDSEGLRQYYANIIAEENIKTANALVIRQSGEIDRLQEEYQTRFGSLSRYG